MRKNIQITVNSETGFICKDSEILGISEENLQGKIIFKPEPFVEGTCRMYVENKGSILMQKEEDFYTLDIKSSLLSAPGIEICFKITEPENEKGIPIYSTQKVYFKVLDTIASSSEIPDEYPSWQQELDSRIAELEELEENIEQAEADRETAERERNARVDEAIENIVDLTEEYNQNAVEKTNAFNNNTTQKTNDFNTNATQKVNEFDTNATEKTADFNNNADDRVEELNNIAEGIEDMTTAIQFATFEVDNDMNLVINQAEKLVNTNFSINEEGELEVEIING